MTIAKVKPATWGTNEILTSPQMNLFDTKLITALDKTTAGDTLAGIVVLTGAGRFATPAPIGPDPGPGATATITQATSGRLVHVQAGLVTASCYYDLSNTGAVDGDTIAFYCSPTFTFEVTIRTAASATLFTLGALNSSDGTFAEFIYYAGGSVWQLQSSKGSRTWTTVYTTTTSFYVPTGVTNVMVTGCGAGGQGGGGAAGNGGGGSNGGGGGGGGGGAQVQTRTYTVTPGVQYTAAIGAGGSGGLAGAAGANGGNSYFGPAAGTILGYFLGGEGGSPGGAGGVGGSPSNVSTALTLVEGAGGAGGATGQAGIGGLASSGAPGTVGGTSTPSGGIPSIGGGSGGGGGMSSNHLATTVACGNGGLGGATSTPGLVGSIATFGCGGGGGGGGGDNGAPGAAGGTGGDGVMIITWVK